MIAHGHLLVKNQMIEGAYHHRNTACALRFTNNRMEETIPQAVNYNNRGPQ